MRQNHFPLDWVNTKIVHVGSAYDKICSAHAEQILEDLLRTSGNYTRTSITLWLKKAKIGSLEHTNTNGLIYWKSTELWHHNCTKNYASVFAVRTIEGALQYFKLINRYLTLNDPWFHYPTMHSLKRFINSKPAKGQKYQFDSGEGTY